MMLTTAQAVLDKLGVGGTFPNNVALAEAGLEYATAQLENTLDTALDSAEVMDVWNYTPGLYATASNYTPLKLIASRGFWAEDPTVYVSDDGTAINDVTTLTPLDRQYYAFNKEQGVLTLTYRPAVGLQTVAVIYSAGFTSGSSAVPSWLQQAAVAYAIQNIMLHNTGYNKKEMRDKSTEQLRLAYSVVSRHIRTRHGEFPYDSRVL